MPIDFSFKSVRDGLASVAIPLVFEGTINQFLDDRHVDIATMVDWVNTKKDLLTLFSQYGGTGFEDVLRRAHNICPNTEWLTAEYLIDACRSEHPAIASLFLGWGEARAWLEVQVESLRAAFNQANNLAPKPAGSPTVLPASGKNDSTTVPPENGKDPVN